MRVCRHSLKFNTWDHPKLEASNLVPRTDGTDRFREVAICVRNLCHFLPHTIVVTGTLWITPACSAPLRISESWLKASREYLRSFNVILFFASVSSLTWCGALPLLWSKAHQKTRSALDWLGLQARSQARFFIFPCPLLYFLNLLHTLINVSRVVWQHHLVQSRHYPRRNDVIPIQQQALSSQVNFLELPARLNSLVLDDQGLQL